jgi:hypothetical protein
VRFPKRHSQKVVPIPKPIPLTNISKKDTQNGMKENLDREIQQGFKFRYPYIHTQDDTNEGYMPRSDRRKDMHKNLDGA